MDDDVCGAAVTSVRSQDGRGYSGLFKIREDPTEVVF